MESICHQRRIRCREEHHRRCSLLFQRTDGKRTAQQPKWRHKKKTKNLSIRTFGVLFLGCWHVSLSQCFVWEKPIHQHHHQHHHHRQDFLLFRSNPSHRSSTITNEHDSTSSDSTSKSSADTVLALELDEKTGGGSRPIHNKKNRNKNKKNSNSSRPNSNAATMISAVDRPNIDLSNADETTDWESILLALVEVTEEDSDEKARERQSVDELQIIQLLVEMKQSTKWKGAIRLLQWLEMEKSENTSLVVLPDLTPDIYHAVIQCCVSSGESDHGVQILTSMCDDSSLLPLPNSFQITLTLLSKQRKWKVCLELLDLMVQHNIQRTVITYNTVILACTRAQQVGVAKSLLVRMKQDDGGKHHHKNNINHNHNTSIRPTAMTYSTLIGACATPTRWKEALSLLDQCYREPGVEPDIYVYTNAIRACAKGRKYQRALNILQVAKDKGLQVDAYAYTNAMEACRNSKQWRKAEDLMKEMEQDGVRPTEVTYSVLISALGNGLQYQKALSYLDRMIEESLTPNLYTYNAAITALAKASKKRRNSGTAEDLSTKALALLKQMKDSGIEPDGFCYSSAIACCGAEGRWVEACEILDIMKQGGPSMRPNKISYSAAISACGRAGESQRALELYREMEDSGVGVDTVAYNAVLSALRRSNATDVAYEIWAKMCSASESHGVRQRRQTSAQPDIITLTECVGILSNAGCLNLMDEVFAEAVKIGIVLSRESLDEEFEVDLSGMSLPVARAACRFVMRRFLSSDSSVSADQEMVFITGVGVAHHPHMNSQNERKISNSESIFEKNPETSLQSYCCGILKTDFNPPLTHRIPDRAPGTVAVKIPSADQNVRLLL